MKTKTGHIITWKFGGEIHYAFRSTEKLAKDFIRNVLGNNKTASISNKVTLKFPS